MGFVLFLWLRFGLHVSSLPVCKVATSSDIFTGDFTNQPKRFLGVQQLVVLLLVFFSSILLAKFGCRRRIFVFETTSFLECELCNYVS